MSAKSRRNRALRGKATTGDNSVAVASEVQMSEATATEPKVKEPLTLVPTKGKTKGKGSKEITYNQLSRVPSDVDEFNKVTGTESMSELCEYLFVGFNEKSYSEAADEIGEFVDDSWHKDVQTLFRNGVRSMVKLFSGSKTVEEVAALMRPGAEAAQAAKLIALAAEKEAEAKKAAESPKAA